MDPGVNQNFKQFYRLTFIQKLVNSDCHIHGFLVSFNLKDAMCASTVTWKDIKVKFYFCVSVHHSISQIKHQLDATLCRFYFCSHSTCFRHQAPIIKSIKKLARRPLVQVL